MSRDEIEILKIDALLDQDMNKKPEKVSNGESKNGDSKNGESKNGALNKNGDGKEITKSSGEKKRKTRSPSPKKNEKKRSKERSIDKHKRDRSRDKHSDRDRRDRKSRDRHDRRSRDRYESRHDRRSRDRYDRRSRDRYESRHDRRSRDRHDRRSRDRYESTRSRDRHDRRSRDRSKERRERSESTSPIKPKDEVERTQGYKDAATIFVSQIPILATAKDVVKFFAKVGVVRDVRLIPAEKGSRKSRGFGYVEFDTPEQAIRAINEMATEKFDGRTIFMQSQVERLVTTTQKMTNVIKTILPNNINPNNPINAPVVENITKLFIGSIDKSFTESDLRDALKSFGEIVSVEFRDDEKGYHALIQYKDSNTAEDAYHGINGKQIKGKTVKFGLAKDPSKINPQVVVHRNLTLVNTEPKTIPMTHFTTKTFNLHYTKPTSGEQRTIANITSNNNSNSNNNNTSHHQTHNHQDFDPGLDKLDDDRGVSLNAKSRAILMSKLQRSDDFSNNKGDQYSPCVLLKNVFNPKEEEGNEWPKEIEEDISQECGKYGKISHCCVDPHSEGHVYIRFETSDFAKNAIRDLNGRWFGKRQIVAEIYPLSQYNKKFEK
eukprot:TRINITY_DN3823_c0_g1_i1.p1 TRINITY_DN3823_c0_g1~~TRINITY_DN3823_c0_g1_i1.p1  ORF type:complete len:605 (+),score=198.60 TRINITY_DN3823_c0_g1_i1:46-1860(+)